MSGLWSLAAPDKLKRKVRSRLGQEKGGVWLSPISVWELLALAERGQVRLDAEPRAWVREALEQAPLEEAVLNHEVALRSREVGCRTRIPPTASWWRRRWSTT